VTDADEPECNRGDSLNAGFNAFRSIDVIDAHDSCVAREAQSSRSWVPTVPRECRTCAPGSVRDKPHAAFAIAAAVPAARGSVRRRVRCVFPAADPRPHSPPRGVLKAQQRANLVQAHVQRTAMSDEGQAPEMFPIVKPIVAGRPRRARKETELLVVANGFHLCVGCTCEVADAHGFHHVFRSALELDTIAATGFQVQSPNELEQGT